MRFDKIIELISMEVVEDNIGGHTLEDRVIERKLANIEELTYETISRVYGNTSSKIVKAIIKGNIPIGKVDKIGYNLEKYKILNMRLIKNKTCITLELIDNVNNKNKY